MSLNSQIDLITREYAGAYKGIVLAKTDKEVKRLKSVLADIDTLRNTMMANKGMPDKEILPAAIKKIASKDKEQAERIVGLLKLDKSLLGNSKKVEKFNPYHDELGRFTHAPGSSANNQLDGLRAEARKYGNFDEFSRDYSINLLRGQYWHITDDPDFELKEDVIPRDVSSISIEEGEGIPGLMISGDIENWADTFSGRSFAVEIDLSNARKDEDFNVVNRGFGNELFVHNPSKVSVIRTIPLQDAIVASREYDRVIPQSEDELRIFWEAARSSEIEKSLTLSGNDLFFLLKFKSSQALTRFQDMAKEAFQDQKVKWTDPEEFHVTLVFVHDLELEETVRLSENVEMEEPVDIQVDGFSVFRVEDGADSHTLFLNVARTIGLSKLQSRMYDLITKLSDAKLSKFSDPSRWSPHITIGTSEEPFDKSKLPEVGGVGVAGRVIVASVDFGVIDSSVEKSKYTT